MERAAVSLLASKEAKGNVIDTLIAVGAVVAFIAVVGFYIWGVFGAGREKTKAVDHWVLNRLSGGRYRDATVERGSRARGILLLVGAGLAAALSIFRIVRDGWGLRTALTLAVVALFVIVGVRDLVEASKSRE